MAKKTILCVESNEQTLSLRKFMLETRGYDVMVALSQEAAQALLESYRFDLVLTRMPSVIEFIVAVNCPIRTLFLAGEGQGTQRANSTLPPGKQSPVEILEAVITLLRKQN